MGRLSLAASRLIFMDPRSRPPAAEAKGPTPVQSSAPWRAWYKTKRWRDTKERVHIRDGYTCQAKGCGRVLVGKSPDDDSPVCDHVRPHRGDERLFWSESNLQTLCKSPCHDRHKQKLEQESRHHSGVWD